MTATAPEWAGTASELSSLLVGLDTPPNALTRRLNVGADRLLNEYGVAYENSRCHAGRQVKLTLASGKA